MKFFLTITVCCVVMGGALGFAKAPVKDAPAEAIKNVIALDKQLGGQRNHGCESKPMVDVIKDYVAALDQIDFSECPDDFRTAFKGHRDAWEKSESFFASFGHLRGEMHDLFEIIRASGEDSKTSLEEIERQVWGTCDVEAVMRIHDVEPS